MTPWQRTIGKIEEKFPASVQLLEFMSLLK